jgi:hypothetical protein
MNHKIDEIFNFLQNLKDNQRCRIVWLANIKEIKVADISGDLLLDIYFEFENNNLSVLLSSDGSMDMDNFTFAHIYAERR